MKFEECRIGDIVTLKSDKIISLDIMGPKDAVNTYIPNTKNFIILALNYGTKTVDIKSMYNEVKEIQSTFVLPSCLCSTRHVKFSMSDVLHGKSITRPQTSDYKFDFEVRHETNELSAYYHGVKLATVRCHPDDAYDEEFGLNLLLRRVCQKLKDSHIVVETVEELL